MKKGYWDSFTDAFSYSRRGNNTGWVLRVCSYLIRALSQSLHTLQMNEVRVTLLQCRRLVAKCFVCVSTINPYGMGNYCYNRENEAKNAKQSAQNTVAIKRSNFESQALDCKFLSMSLSYS